MAKNHPLDVCIHGMSRYDGCVKCSGGVWGRGTFKVAKRAVIVRSTPEERAEALAALQRKVGRDA